MFGWINRRMVSKIFLGMALVSSIAFLTISLVVGTHVEKALNSATQTSAEQMVRIVRSSVEQAMLSGNGIKVKDLVVELKTSVEEDTQDIQGIKGTEIHIYDATGSEVFTPKPPAPSASEIDAQVARVLKDRTRQVESNHSTTPVPSEERCSGEFCHDASEALRGVLSLRVRPESCRDERSEVVSAIVRSGFLHVMTASRKGDPGIGAKVENFLADVSEASPAILGVAVYDNEGDSRLGVDMDEMGISSEQVAEVLAVGNAKGWPIEAGSVHVVPLAREERCIACHTVEEKLRGALLVALAPPSDPSGCDSVEIETLVDISIRHIMMSELGRIIARFLDSVAELDAVEELVLYDGEGRVYWNTTHPEPPKHIADVLKTQKSTTELLVDGGDRRLRVVEPLVNTKKCARCHGNSSEIRGLVEVSLSTKMAATAREDTRGIVMLTTALTVVSLFLLLIVLLQLLVIRPVREISGVASSIGKGELDVEVRHSDSGGDEVARLGFGINAMIRDLRTKFQLEKFVSKGAKEAAQSGGLRTSAEGGERTDATILFSDIRGFTAYSEQVEAEEVVEMLNRLLRAQTDIVHKFAGDVDKFVGDELMAIFQGPDATLRATACALELIDVVVEVRKSNLSIGVGISTGEVVMGAIGHEDRLDYTVIGDVVNTGARLCSAALPDQILVTNEVYKLASETEGCNFALIEPLSVKGKKEPLVVYSVTKLS
jgi:adenylate cyclase